MTFLYLGIINKRARVQKYFLILEHSKIGKVIVLVGNIFSFSCPCLWTGWRFQEHLDSSLLSASPPPLFPLPNCGGRYRTESERDGNTALKVSLGCVLMVLRLISQRRQWHPSPILLPGKSHGWRSLVGCSPWGRWESNMTERLHFHFSLSCIGEGNGNPLQCSCLENPRDEGAWWAAVYGVSQSRTRLKRLSITFYCYRHCV